MLIARETARALGLGTRIRTPEGLPSLPASGRVPKDLGATLAPAVLASDGFAQARHLPAGCHAIPEYVFWRGAKLIWSVSECPRTWAPCWRVTFCEIRDALHASSYGWSLHISRYLAPIKSGVYLSTSAVFAHARLPSNRTERPCFPH